MAKMKMCGLYRQEKVQNYSMDYSGAKKGQVRTLCTRVVTCTDFQCTAANWEHSVIFGKRPYLSKMADNPKYTGNLLS